MSVAAEQAAEHTTGRKPPVRVTEADYERLSNLAEGLRGDGGAILRQAVDRARVVRDGSRAAPFVRLGSQVDYRDLLTGRSRRVEITLPDRADIDAGRLSVTAPVGAALIGLAVGDAISWTGADGRPHAVIVDGVSQA